MPPGSIRRGSAHLRSAGPLLGLPLLALVWVVGLVLAEPRLRAGLAERAEPIVVSSAGEDGESLLRLEIAGRDVTARGEAPDPSARDAALARLAALPGIRRLTSRVDLVAEQVPFAWSARRRATDRVDLAGYRPAELRRGALAARLAAALPDGVTLRDGARAARGAPKAFADAAALGVALVAQLAPGAVAELSDATLSLRGEAQTAAAYDAVQAGLRDLPAGFRAGTVEIEPPLVAPYTWSLARGADGALTLQGHVPSERAREAIRGGVLAGLDGARLGDATRPARGLAASVEPRALAAVAAALAALLREGVVALEETRLSVRGEALDAQAIPEIEAMLSRLPAGLERGEVALASRPPSPYRVSVRRRPDAVVIEGHLPDAASREAVLAALRPLLFGERILDRSRLADGAPPGLVAALVSGLGGLGLLASGEVALEDRRLRLTGESLYAESADRLSAQVAGLMPAGWSASAALVVPGRAKPLDPALCRSRLAGRAEGPPLRFAPASADLLPDFYPVLDDLAALARDCPDARIAVAGHRDPPATGPKAAAPDPGLPARRAQAVVEYLLKAGVPAGRLGVDEAAEPATARRAVEFRFGS